MPKIKVEKPVVRTRRRRNDAHHLASHPRQADPPLPRHRSAILRPQHRKPRPASIYDVATAAGVSIQTVSRVMNGHPSVKTSTRTHVLATISRLGYRPEPRGPRAGRRRGQGGDRADLEHHPLRPAVGHPGDRGSRPRGRLRDGRAGDRIRGARPPWPMRSNGRWSRAARSSWSPSTAQARGRWPLFAAAVCLSNFSKIVFVLIRRDALAVVTHRDRHIRHVALNLHPDGSI